MTRSRYDDDLAAGTRPTIGRRRLAALAGRLADGPPWRRAPGHDRQVDPRRPRLPVAPFARRSLGVLLVSALVVVAVVVQLVSIQVIDAEELAARGADQRERFLSLPADRGRIYDRSGEVLAASIDGVAIVADPSSFQPSTSPDGDPLPAAEELGPAIDALDALLDIDRTVTRDRLLSDADFVFLARQVDPAVGQEVLALDLDGITLRQEPRRVYPAGSIGAQVVGLTDIDGAGLGGMELQHDDLLTGTPGWVDDERSLDGRTITSAEREVQSPVPGTDVVLTIDQQLQFTAERVAAEAVERWNAAAASIVVLEVGTGDVLAMASAPGGDPTDRSTLDPASLRNRSVTDVFEPGSVQKAITAAAAIEAGVVTPETVLEVPYSLEYGGRTFTDSHRHPTEDMSFARIIEESSNIGTIMVADRLGEEALAEWLAAFGLGRPTEVGFPGEAGGLLRAVEDWWDTSLPTIAIGQGVAVTLLQQANAYATIANDGVAVQPRLVRGTVDDGGLLVPAPAVPGRRVVSAETAQQVRRMLTAVVEGDRGTGEAAAIDGHLVAGKTGTARKAAADGRGYAPGLYVANFTGMAPADAPEVVVAVMVDEPSTIWGGVVAAPAFAEVMTEALRRRHVPPVTAGPSLTAALRDAAAERAALEAAAARRAEEVRRAAERADEVRVEQLRRDAARAAGDAGEQAAPDEEAADGATP